MKIKILILLGLLFLINPLHSQTLEKISRYNGSSGGIDGIAKIVLDKSGNSIVTGNSSDGFSSFIVSIKYNSNGEMIWKRNFRSIDNGKDYAITAIIDNDNNFIIGGITENNSIDFLLLKYSSNGDLIWSRTFNGTGNSEDRLVSLGIDSENNIYTTGIVTMQSQDICLLKYSSSGELLWEKFYNGNANENDQPYDLQINNNNEIFLTGFVADMNYYTNLILMKYNTNGDIIFVKKYGPSNISSVGTSLVIDDSLNIIVSGYIQDSPYFMNDYLTVKFNNSGELIWSKRYNELIYNQHTNCRVEKVRIDEFQNIYVTGTAIPIVTDNYDFYVGIVTIKYSPLGDTIWINRIQRCNYSEYQSISLEVFNPENIYIATFNENLGSFRDLFLIKLNIAGNISWQFTLQNMGDDRFTSVAIDGFGNIYSAGFFHSFYTSTDYKIFKFNSFGNILWENSYDSENFSNDTGYDVLEDSMGNYYMIGKNYKEYILIKYDNDLNEIWSKVYIDSASITNTRTPLFTCDQSGNIYVTFITRTINNNNSIKILKYSGNGILEWERLYSPSNNDIYGPNSILVDNYGNATLLSYSYNTVSLDFKIILLKYSSNGNLILNKIHNSSTAQNSDRGEKMVMDEDNNMYVVGSSSGETLTIKFNPEGNLLWEKNYTNNQPYVKSLQDVCIDGKGNVFATGFIGVQNQSYNYVTIAYDSGGHQKWVQTFNGVKNDVDMARSVATDTSGNIYVTGEARMNSNNFNSSIVTIKYDSSGNEIWVKNLRSLQNGNIKPAQLKLDEYFNVYVLSASNNFTPHGNGFLTIKYNPAGDSIWKFTHNSNQGYKNYSSAFIIDKDHNLVFAGSTYGLNTSYDISILKVSQFVNIQNNEISLPLVFSLSQNYPNPFNPTTNIKFSIPTTQYTILKVFDIAGREVATLVNEVLQAGEYNFQYSIDNYQLSSGVYFYQLRAEGFVQTRKMVLTK